jgi:hypothetical protein
MSRLPVVAAVTLTLFPAAGLINACSDQTPPTPESSAAQRRFQTNFCTSQYRSLGDVARCLAGSV